MTDHQNKVTYHMTSPIKAKSPAAFAEQYIVESIWRGKFVPGSILPAERELSDLIGVTRTTLREVLQRLARDGWLTIQHGKPTRVNNIWDTSGLNILDTISRLDDGGSLTLADQLLDARTNMSAIYLRLAVKSSPTQVVDLLHEIKDVEDTAEGYINYDWRFNHGSTLIAGNPVYTLMLNGFKPIYHRIGLYYFSSSSARELARGFYAELVEIVESKDIERLIDKLWHYGRESGAVWQEMRSKLTALSDLDEE
ncbi:fatty acid metabolism transcriptional regulator FadR [Pleionea sp. CnH1-48]|uniref:fatty acid metabolism transcriptional regulator FadR n=1 Tax=Pleionea sp. CnH1-48 TaxID=2954494 RepID=UPI0020974178|nr:fatty acid metabolism transcriptional regulator FadR [Pleionea sp. CnH1-48]MCO7225419.1 fatty acid metabolism transcriptional regulator FadR [Pleionea sp. CnH1-48]